MAAIDPSLLSLQGQQSSSSSTPPAQKPKTENENENGTGNSGTSNNKGKEPEQDENDEDDDEDDPLSNEHEQQDRDRALAEILGKLDGDYRPIVPDELVDYYLQRAGFESNDVRIKRLLGLAAQKFVSDIATDAFQYARTRTNATGGGRGRPAGPDTQNRRDRSKTVLTMEDLSAALAEHGINASRRPYYL